MVHLSNASACNVVGIHSPTRGFAIDIKHAMHAIYDYHADESVRLLQGALRDFFPASDESAIALLYTNSRGGAYSRNALYDMERNLSKKVWLVPFASAAHTPREICYDVTHYESARDFVTHFDRSGRKRCQNTIVTLKPHPDAPWHDHALTSPTFFEAIKNTAKQYLRN